MYHDDNMGGGDRFFNPRYNVLHEDGLLTIKTSGYEDDQTHWTGFMTVSPSEPDYDFWYWLARVRQAPDLVEESDLGRWKAEYAATQSSLVEAVR